MIGLSFMALIIVNCFLDLELSSLMLPDLKGEEAQIDSYNSIGFYLMGF
jgi:hypothetical protein